MRQSQIYATFRRNSSEISRPRRHPPFASAGDKNAKRTPPILPLQLVAYPTLLRSPNTTAKMPSLLSPRLQEPNPTKRFLRRDLRQFWLSGRYEALRFKALMTSAPSCRVFKGVPNLSNNGRPNSLAIGRKKPFTLMFWSVPNRKTPIARFS